jgi:hypothetical protein
MGAIHFSHHIARSGNPKTRALSAFPSRDLLVSEPWPCGLFSHETGKLDTRADAKLAENLPQVERDGMNAHEHPLGGLLVAKPLGDQD